MRGMKIGDILIARVIASERPDFDPPQAAATRRAFQERYGERDVLVCASRFPSPSFGRVVREGKGFWFEYAKA